MSKKSAKPQTEIYDTNWYDAKELIQLVRQYSKSLNIVEPVSTLDGLRIQLNKVVDGQQGSYFVPLNINAVDKSFNNVNHWVGLYISKSKSGFEIKYLDTMGHPIDEGVSEMIKIFGNVNYNVENLLLGRSIQFVKHSEDELLLEGNTNDCGPFLVYCISCLANGQDIDIPPRIDLEQSVFLGQFLRDSFTRNKSFAEIYNQVSSQPLPDQLIKSKSTGEREPKNESPSLIKQEPIKVTPKTPQPPEGAVSEIIGKITEGTDIIHDSDESIIVVGRTRAGKSTLVNYLTNPDVLEVKMHKIGPKSKGVPVIDFKDSVSSDIDLPRIGHLRESYTTVPHSWYDKEHNVTYWDCPGFEDTKNYVQDVTNAFYIKRIFSTSKQMKILLVVSWNDLSGEGIAPIKALVDTIKRMFDDFKSINFDTIKGSLSLVVTKAPEGTTVDDVEGLLNEFLSTEYFITNKIAEDIFSTLSESGDKISIFGKQTIPGEIDLSDRGEMLRILNGTEFVPSAVINPPISQESQLKIYGVFEALKDHIGELIATLMEKYTWQNTVIAKNILDEGELIASFESFKLARNKFEDLLDLANGEKIPDIISSFMHDFPNEFAELKKNFIALEFCQQVKQDLPVKDVIVRIKEIIRAKKDFIDQKSTEIEGQLVGIITREASDTLSKFTETVKSNLYDKFSKALESLDPKLIEYCQTYVREISNLFSTKLTLENLIFFEEKLKPYGVVDTLGALAVHARILDTLSSVNRDHYYEILNMVVRPLESLQEEYSSMVRDLEIQVSTNFESYFHKFINEQFNETNFSLFNLQDLLKQLAECIDGIQIQPSITDLVEVTLRIWPEKNLLAAKGEIARVEALNEIGIKIQLAGRDKLDEYIDRLKSVKNKLEILFSRKIEEDISDNLDKLISGIKESSLELSQKGELLELVKNLSDESGKDVYQLMLNFGKSIQQKFSIDNSSILEIIQESQVLGRFVNGVKMIELFNSKMTALSEYILSDKTLHTLVVKVKDHVLQIEKESASLDSVKSVLKQLDQCFSGLINFQGRQLTDLVKYLQQNLISKIPGEYLAELDVIKDSSDSLDHGRHLTPLLRLGHEVKDQLDWYADISNIHEVVITKGYRFINEFPLVSVDNFTNFIERLKAEGLRLDHNISHAAYKVSQLNNLLKHSWSVPQVIRNGNELVIEGECLKTGDLPAHIPNGITQIKIKCLNSLVFDKSIHAQGVNIVVIAPYWYVADKVKIDLSGKDAVNFPTQAMNGVGFKPGGGEGSDGQNGLMGLRGQNSGQLYGVGYKFDGLQNITLVLAGGRGGNGQNGGNGANGQYGLDATIQDFWGNRGIWQPNESDMYTRFDKMYNRIELCKGYPGQVGGNAGKGGAGGKAGSPGKMKIIDSSGKELEQLYPGDEGRNGRDGLQGTPGIGGKYGNDLKVYYFQNQYTTLREALPLYVGQHAKSGYVPLEKHFNYSGEFRDVHFEKSIVPEVKKEITSLQTKVSKDEFYYKVHGQVLEGLGTLYGDGTIYSEHPGIMQYVSEFNRYYSDGIEKILELRISDLAPVLKGANVGSLSPKYLFNKQFDNIDTLAKDLSNSLSEADVVLVPLNLNSSHWVGIVFAKQEGALLVTYMDSENSQIPEKLLDKLMISLAEQGYVNIEFTQEGLASQISNNCGPEMVENFVLYLTGSRITQHEAVPYHSQLLERDLLSNDLCTVLLGEDSII